MSEPNADLFRSLFQFMLSPQSTQEAEAMLQRAAELGLGGVMLPTCLVPMAKQVLKGSTVRVVAAVNFPSGGMTQPEALFCVTHAESLGADELLLVVPPTAMLDGRLDDICGLLRQARRLTRFPVITVAFELPMLEQSAQGEFLASLHAGGVTSVMPHLGLTPHLTQEDDVGFIHKMMPGAEVTAFAGTAPGWNAKSLVAAGARRVLSLRANTLVEEL